jgi:hypothetical protein
MKLSEKLNSQNPAPGNSILKIVQGEKKVKKKKNTEVKKWDIPCK